MYMVVGGEGGMVWWWVANHRSGFRVARVTGPCLDWKVLVNSFVVWCGVWCGGWCCYLCGLLTRCAAVENCC